METKKDDDKKAEPVIKPLLKPSKSREEGKKKKKSVVWDVKTLEEQELERKLHPARSRVRYREYRLALPGSKES